MLQHSGQAAQQTQQLLQCVNTMLCSGQPRAVAALRLLLLLLRSGSPEVVTALQSEVSLGGHARDGKPVW